MASSNKFKKSLENLRVVVVKNGNFKEIEVKEKIRVPIDEDMDTIDEIQDEIEEEVKDESKEGKSRGANCKKEYVIKERVRIERIPLYNVYKLVS